MEGFFCFFPLFKFQHCHSSKLPLPRPPLPAVQLYCHRFRRYCAAAYSQPELIWLCVARGIAAADPGRERNDLQGAAEAGDNTCQATEVGMQRSPANQQWQAAAAQGHRGSTQQARQPKDVTVSAPARPEYSEQCCASPQTCGVSRLYCSHSGRFWYRWSRSLALQDPEMESTHTLS